MRLRSLVDPLKTKYYVDFPILLEYLRDNVRSSVSKSIGAGGEDEGEAELRQPSQVHRVEQEVWVLLNESNKSIQLKKEVSILLNESNKLLAWKKKLGSY